MGEKLVVGPVNKGLRTDRLPFVIDNDSFPTLQNAYQWRGRVKRKRGTAPLGRLTVTVNSSSVQTDGSGNFNGNLFTILSLEATASLVFNSIKIGTDVFTDPSTNGNLTGSTGGTGTVNYATGDLTISGGPATTNIQFNYYPGLPVMGLEEFNIIGSLFPKQIAFDTVYAYNISTVSPFTIYNVNFYKNPASDATNLPGYVPKANQTKTTWNGADYQQFWTTNYQGSLWATNGVDNGSSGFTGSTIGMQFVGINGVLIVAAGPPAILTITTSMNHGLVIGDFVFINEITGMTGINFQTGYVTATPAANQITIEIPKAKVGGAWMSGGIVQYLTNRFNTSIDCLRWYDGDPTVPSSTSGWVNFCPPLSQNNYSIGGLPLAIYYLVGARMIFQFKDRLLFIGPVVQTSQSGAQAIYLQDTVIYSQNGTSYYTCSYTNSPAANADTPTITPTNGFSQILVPTNQTATPSAYFNDSTGFGGFITSGLDQTLTTVGPNEDALIMGFDKVQTKFLYTGNDIVPFVFYIVNSELGSSSTFSSVVMDEGVISKGNRGITITSQQQCTRIDLDILDTIFQFKLDSNGNERFCSQRDFLNEWVYFTYPVNQFAWKFPTQTLQYNYRDNSWSVFNETYTTYGTFRQTAGISWATLPSDLTWEDWTDPWNSGDNTGFQPVIIGGNQEGFVLFRQTDITSEAPSLTITSFSGSSITCTNHCLNTGDYIVITECIGTIGAQVNGKIFQVLTSDADTFSISPGINSGTYLGGGLITRIYIPFIQTKQFPTAWSLARKTRIGPQQYLLSTTNLGQITLQIYLSQDDDNPYNAGPIVPSVSSVNNSLTYSQVLYTCPESTNLGLTAANINLNMPTAVLQNQTWHRVNTSLIGDTVQLGFTLSDQQVQQFTAITGTYSITGATQAYPCVLTVENDLSANMLIQISGILGMTQLNNNTSLQNPVYQIMSATTTTLTINVDSTTFSAYTSGGTIVVMDMPNQFEEIELHGFILDVQPSQLLV